MAPCDSQTPNPPGAVVKINVEIKHDDGEVEHGESASCCAVQVFSELQDLTSFADNIFLYANDNWRIGRDANHK